MRSPLYAAACAAIALMLAVPAASVAQPAAAPTPRLANGQPDLSGIWMGNRSAEVPDVTGDFKFETAARGADLGNNERDAAVRQRSDPNKPVYKPEFWPKVKLLDLKGNLEDPSFHCKPEGVPRMGPPQKIVQTPTEIIFLYESGNTHRIIPTDGRDHDPIKAEEQTWMGDSVGKWNGDTLVIDTVGFNDESWIDWAGYFHSNQMRVTETLKREGDSLRYDVLVEDPGVLLEPYKPEGRRLTLTKDSKFSLFQDLPCEERSLQDMTFTDVRG